MPTYKQRVITAIRALANPEGSSEEEICNYLLQNDEHFKRGIDKTTYVLSAIRALVTDGVLTYYYAISPRRYKFTQEYLNFTRPRPSNTSTVTVEKTVTVDEQLAEQLAEAKKMVQ